MKRILTLAFAVTVAFTSCKKEDVKKHCGKVSNVRLNYGSAAQVIGADLAIRYEDGTAKMVSLSATEWYRQPYSVGTEYCD